MESGGVWWNLVIPVNYESGKILVILVENSMIILTGIVLHGENYIPKKVHQIPEIPEILAGIGGGV